VSIFLFLVLVAFFAYFYRQSVRESRAQQLPKGVLLSREECKRYVARVSGDTKPGTRDWSIDI
jgi:hypothetical protein